MSTETDVLDRGYSQIVTTGKCAITTVRPLVLTQELNPRPEYVRVNPAADLEVVADEVTIRGQIKAPGKTIRIFARVLKIEPVSTASGPQPAELNVDGANGFWQDNPAVLSEGKKGSRGTSPDDEPPERNSELVRGGDGQSADKPGNEWMHGKDGKHGNPGESAGSIFVLCGSFLPSERFTLSAKGGCGADGQKGQGGAKGGDGGDGADAQYFSGGFMKLGYKRATDGGNGGMGGNGGRGGNGGNGGKGGRIVFRCVNEMGPHDGKFVAFADGGAKGQPGSGGARGAKGKQGRGGNKAELGTAILMWRNEGREGAEGRTGKPGDPGSDGADGVIELSFDATYPELKSVWRKAFA